MIGRRPFSAAGDRPVIAMIALPDAVDLDTFRIRYEFLEMPGLRLTVAQAARLFGVSTAHAADTLKILEEQGFLGASVDAHQELVYGRRN